MRKGTDKIRDENKEENRNIQLVYEKRGWLLFI